MFLLTVDYLDKTQGNTFRSQVLNAFNYGTYDEQKVSAYWLLTVMRRTALVEQFEIWCDEYCHQRVRTWIHPVF